MQRNQSSQCSSCKRTSENLNIFLFHNKSLQFIVKTFYFSNLKETSKNSVQSLYYLFTKAGVLSLRNTRAGTKKGMKYKIKSIK